MSLYEIVLPPGSGEEGANVKGMIGLMEQWYMSMQSLASDPANKEKNYFSMEIALPEGSSDIAFYCALHKDYGGLLEKIVVGTFPDARVNLCKEDYSPFPDKAAVATAYATHTAHPVLPIKTYKEMEGDPIQVIISSFTKLKKNGEALALQFMIRPTGDRLVKKYTGMLDEIRKGTSIKELADRENLLKQTFSALTTMFTPPKSDEEKKENPTKHVDEIAAKEIQRKLEHTLVETNLRVVASAETQLRADEILKDVTATFNQFTEVGGNALSFEKVKDRKANEFIYDFVFRLFSEDQLLPLNLEEVATLYHFPLYVKDINQLKTVDATEVGAPPSLKQEGILLGTNVYRGQEHPIYFPKEDRMRHLYLIGQTGTGKTTILKNMIIQDIKNGDGCCFIDPHGSDVMDILANVPRERADDVIYFDPSYTARPMGLNMLEYDVRYPEQKTFVVNEMLSIFNKLFDMQATGGPGFEQYFRNATLLVMEHPESGNTLLEIARVFSDKDFRDYKLSKTKNPLLLQFWQNAEKTTGEQGLQNWTQYVTSKFDVFLSNDIMRPIIAQEKSAFNLRDIMDGKKIFLVNLSKGRLGDLNASLLGLILVGKFLQAALSRVDIEDVSKRADFYLYIDEFQNVTTPSIAAILSEARKYRLSLNIAHQFIAQLTDQIKSAVFGNVGSMISYRVGPDDAQYLESQFAPEVKAGDLMRVSNWNGYIRMLSGGEPKRPFSLRGASPPRGDIAVIESLKELSYLKYGRPKEEVDTEILKKYQL
jgi:hypothetical protein